MLSKLKQYWKVNNTGLFLILSTFALAGSLTAFMAREITGWIGIKKFTFYWWMVKALVFVFGYQIIILFTSLLFGQFRFFWEYEKRILQKFGIIRKKRVTERKPDDQQKPINIAIFASGAGSNAEKIIHHFKESKLAAVALVVTDQPAAGVLKIAADNKVPVLVLDMKKFLTVDGYVPELGQYDIRFIVLAGFLRKIPDQLINHYPRKIVNIHPALLPAHGGKGMYGWRVHQSVIDAGDTESGISIHFVDNGYDTGEVIHQSKLKVDAGETAESLAGKVLQLEHQAYPLVIEDVIVRTFF